MGEQASSAAANLAASLQLIRNAVKRQAAVVSALGSERGLADRLRGSRQPPTLLLMHCRVRCKPEEGCRWPGCRSPEAELRCCSACGWVAHEVCSFAARKLQGLQGNGEEAGGSGGPTPPPPARACLLPFLASCHCRCLTLTCNVQLHRRQQHIQAPQSVGAGCITACLRSLTFCHRPLSTICPQRGSLCRAPPVRRRPSSLGAATARV